MQGGAPPHVIQTSFAGGEITPALSGHVDLAKFHTAVALGRNMFVDYRGGLSSRPGTQQIAQPLVNNTTRLVAFVFSTGQTYVLVFGHQYIAFIKNPGTPSYWNSSNAGYILSAGVPYQISTPYIAADLALLKFSQSADVMTITHPSYARMDLRRLAETNWTLTAPTIGATIAAPLAGLTASITPKPAGSTDPEDTTYLYTITSVDNNGVESPMGNVAVVHGLNLDTTPGTVTLSWNPIVGAKNYKVYKALPAPGGIMPSLANDFGFCDHALGPQFTDGHIVPDFSQSPPRYQNPFVTGAITGFTISAAGAAYPIGATTLSVTDPNGGTAVLLPIFNSTTYGGTAGIVGLVILNPGHGITTGASLAAAGGAGAGFVGTVTTGPASGASPGCSSYFQQRQVFSGSANNPLAIIGSRPGSFLVFDRSDPTIASDAYQFILAAQQVNGLRFMLPMPGGLVLFTSAGVSQLTGGSANPNNPTAVTPSSAVIVPQSYFGCANVPPIIVDYDILYVQDGGAVVRDLSYNFFVNIYTGVDITILSEHLFSARMVNEWAYQNTPFKIVWAIRDDGILLSLTYLKAQEVYGWTHHDTQGYFESVVTVREGTEDATYFVVRRPLGGSTVRFIERLAQRNLAYQGARSAWSLDCAISTAPTFPNATIQIADNGVGKLVTASAAVFGSGDVGKVIRGLLGGAARVTDYTSTTVVTVTTLSDFPLVPNTPTPAAIAPNNWMYDAPISTVSGLTALNNATVWALVDGAVQGPFLVAGGSITLTAPGVDVVVGLFFQGQFKSLRLDVGEPTIQGKRKRVVAMTTIIKDSPVQGLKYGLDFEHLYPFRPGLSDIDVPASTVGLMSGEQRIAMDQDVTTTGQVCIQQDLPLPFTVLAIVPEVELADEG